MGWPLDVAGFHGHDQRGLYPSLCWGVVITPVSIHRLLILLLSLSILLLVPTNSGAATAAPVIQQMVTAAAALDQPLAPTRDDDDALPVATLSAATETPAPTPFSDDIGNDGLPVEPGLGCPLRRRIITLTIGGAPPPGTRDLTTPWPTGPPTA